LGRWSPPSSRPKNTRKMRWRRNSLADISLCIPANSLFGDFLTGGASGRAVRRRAPTHRRWRKSLVVQAFRRQPVPSSAEPTVHGSTLRCTLLLRKSPLFDENAALWSARPTRRRRRHGSRRR
jgi:hypothetical protein